MEKINLHFQYRVMVFVFNTIMGVEMYAYDNVNYRVDI